jgi:exodeoxyribonuclease VII small subunit
MTEKAVEGLSFEEAMAELERVVGQLESGRWTSRSRSRSTSAARRSRRIARRSSTTRRRRSPQITLDANGQPKGTTPVEGL